MVVQFNSGGYLCARKSPYALHPSLRRFPNFAFGTIPTFVWRWPLLVFSRKMIERFLFLCLSPPGDRWCDVLVFMPTGSVSSSSTLQIFTQCTSNPVRLAGYLQSVQDSLSAATSTQFPAPAKLCFTLRHPTTEMQPFPTKELITNSISGDMFR